LTRRYAAQQLMYDWNTTSTTCYGRPTKRSANSSANCSSQTAPHQAEKTHVKTIILEETAAQRTRQVGDKRAAAQTVKNRADSNACSPDPDANQKKTLALAERAPARRANHLHAGTLPLAVFLPERRLRKFQTGRTGSRPTTDLLQVRKKHHRRSSRRSSRNAPPCLSQTAASIDARSLLALPEDAHPTTRFITRNFISRPATSVSVRGKPNMAKLVAICWDQWYPEAAGSPPCKRANPFYADATAGIRRKKEIRGTPAQLMGNHPAQPRHRQRLLRCRSNRIGHEKLAARH